MSWLIRRRSATTLRAVPAVYDLSVKYGTPDYIIVAVRHRKYQLRK